MASEEELDREIAEARRKEMDSEEEYLNIQEDIYAAEERQWMRRSLERINESIERFEADSKSSKELIEQIDADAAGPYLADSAASGAKPKLTKNPGKYVKRGGDVSDCRFNVVKKEHTWTIVGMSWLQNALRQVSRGKISSDWFSVGSENNENVFWLDYMPDANWGSLVIGHYGPNGFGVSFRYKLFIKHSGGDFIQWGEVGDEFKPNPVGTSYHGPDVRSYSQDGSARQIGIFGLSHEELLESAWVENDSITIKVELEVRTDELCAPPDLEYVCESSVEVPPSDLIHKMRRLLKSGRFSDVTFIVDGERIPVHSAVLCMHSEVFERMFNGGMREAFEKEVVITECDTVVFKTMLEFLYTDAFDAFHDLLKHSSSAPSRLLQRVFAVSHKYEITRLQLWCEQQLCDLVSLDNVCEVLSQAHLFDAQQLQQTCLNFIKNNLPKVIISPAFGRLNAEWPEITLKMFPVIAGVDQGAIAAAVDAFASLKRERARDRKDCNGPSESGSDGGGAWLDLDHMSEPRVIEAIPHSNNQQPCVSNEGVVWHEHVACVDFCARDYGDEYIHLSAGERILVRPGLVEGWAFGHSLSQATTGWFPPSFVRRCAE